MLDQERGADLGGEPASLAADQPADIRRHYGTPRLTRYGSLTELTHNLSNGPPGDLAGGSYAA